MRFWVIFFLLFVILLGVNALQRPTHPAEAIASTGLAPVDVNDINGDCSRLPLQVEIFNRRFTKDDGAGIDYYHLVVYDGNGIPHYSADKQTPGFGFPVAVNIVVDINENFLNPMTARPLRVVMYDTTSAGNLSVGTIEQFPMIASVTFDPANYAGSCGTLPFVRDPRMNPIEYYPYQTAAIYCINGRIDIYAIDPITSNGTLVIRVLPDEIAAVGIPEINTLLDASPDGNIRLYRLNTGEFQVNAPLNNQRDGYIFIWDGCP